MATADLDNILKQVGDLSQDQKLTLIEELARQLRPTPEADHVRSTRFLRGILADRGPSPSSEDIDEARRELWGAFPRDIDVVPGVRSDGSRPTDAEL